MEYGVLYKTAFLVVNINSNKSLARPGFLGLSGGPNRGDSNLIESLYPLLSSKVYRNVWKQTHCERRWSNIGKKKAIKKPMIPA